MQLFIFNFHSFVLMEVLYDSVTGLPFLVSSPISEVPDLFDSREVCGKKLLFLSIIRKCSLSDLISILHKAIARLILAAKGNMCISEACYFQKMSFKSVCFSIQVLFRFIHRIFPYFLCIFDHFTTNCTQSRPFISVASNYLS